MAPDAYTIANRAEFDDFWVSGVQLGQLQSLDVFEASEAQFQMPSQSKARRRESSPLAEPPVTAQVWWRYATERRDNRIDLLVDPGADGVPQAVDETGRRLRARTAVENILANVIDGDDVTLESTRLTEGFGYLALDLTYEEMVTRLLPLTSWRGVLEHVVHMTRDERRNAMRVFRRVDEGDNVVEESRLGWFLHLLAFCGRLSNNGNLPRITYGAKSVAITNVDQLLKRVRFPTRSATPVGRVTLNRKVRASVTRSGAAVKADATRALFDVRCDEVRWAVLDTGIDARHVWFRHLDPRTREPFTNPFENEGTMFNYTRIAKAFDFTRQRTSGSTSQWDPEGDPNVDLPGNVPIALSLGERFYEPPQAGHGTHVAGILGGSRGLCPDIELLDYRVLGPENQGNEFTVVAALRHILEQTRRANQADPTGRNRDLPIHGVNLSLALDVDVSSDACGWSLVCRLCDDLVRAGVIVVVAAGNTGFEDSHGSLRSTGQNYRTVSITDPGNTERVITVGSTDADRPREHGVSYFSARGPTADGRLKPDLVAPGNSITSSYGYRRGGEDHTDAAATLSGTSMAAAHVSGCAALLIARHRELIGKPDEVKKILMETATDLCRDRNFQGAGLVDALRAVQSV